MKLSEMVAALETLGVSISESGIDELVEVFASPEHLDLYSSFQTRINRRYAYDKRLNDDGEPIRE